jgi:uncharacterized protein (TIGR03790 family)
MRRVPVVVACVCSAALCWESIPIARADSIDPKQVFLVVNRAVPASQRVAEHYCQRRGVPPENVVALDLPESEDISRSDYDQHLAEPLRLALAERREQVKVLLPVWGVPLRVGPPTPTPAEQAELAALAEKTAAAQAHLEELVRKLKALEESPPAEDEEQVQSLSKERDQAEADLKDLERRRRHLSYEESQAAVDSELALLWWGAYELRRWQSNPLYFQVPDEVRRTAPATLMVSRLDGPTPELAMRIVDDALAAEETGLAGRVYVDARGIGFDAAQDGGFGYGGYDQSLRDMARLLDAGGLTVTLDDQGELFPSAACPDAALYCGWYSLARYVDSCRFVQGAVAYHIASSEAVSLRNPASTYWCKNLLEQGACATLGPVAEPYTIGFPKPAEFFGLLATGESPLVECYARTSMLSSWMTVLVGDPLYNPFAKAPRLTPDQVRPSPNVATPPGPTRE